MIVTSGVELWELLEELKGMNATMAKQGELVISELVRIREVVK